MAALGVALDATIPLPALAGGIKVKKVALEKVRGAASMNAMRLCSGKPVLESYFLSAWELLRYTIVLAR